MLKREVLRKKEDFNRVYRKGRSLGERVIVLFYRSNGLPYNRTAFLASRKVGNSVQRNRAKRLMRESWRMLEKEVSLGYDLIIIARNTINGKTCAQVQQSLERGLRKAKLR